MIQRVLERRLLEELEESRAVALLGPRQAGKTTLALQVGESRQSIYLESPADRARLEDPEAFLAAHLDELVIRLRSPAHVGVRGIHARSQVHHARVRALRHQGRR